jgi:hypothetical protein
MNLIAVAKPTSEALAPFSEFGPSLADRAHAAGDIELDPSHAVARFSTRRLVPRGGRRTSRWGFAP